MLARGEVAGLASQSRAILEDSIRKRSSSSSAAAAVPARNSSFARGGSPAIPHARAASEAVTSKAKHARSKSLDRIRGRSVGSVRSLRDFFANCFSSSLLGGSGTRRPRTGGTDVKVSVFLQRRFPSGLSLHLDRKLADAGFRAEWW